MRNINLITAVILILGIGLLSGYSAGAFHTRQRSFPEIRQVDDINPGVCTVKFLSYSGGILKGVIDGRHTRLAYSADDILDLEPGQSFEIPTSQISLASYYDAENLPEGALYIASSQGKYYYSVLDSRAFRITPKNRLYFDSLAAAEAMGYLSPK